MTDKEKPTTNDELTIKDPSCSNCAGMKECLRKLSTVQVDPCIDLRDYKPVSPSTSKTNWSGVVPTVKDEMEDVESGFTCQKCRRSRVYSNTFVTLSKLIGGYHARLCDSCCNEWREFVSSQPVWRKHNAHCILIKLLTGSAKNLANVNSSRLRSLAEEQIAIDDGFYELAKEWIDTIPECQGDCGKCTECADSEPPAEGE